MKLRWDPPGKTEKSDGKYVRERSADPYHTSRWTKISRAFRASHPLCAECRRKGVVKPATCVDHIEPWPVCGEQGFYDWSNLQALCDECNHDKGQRDKPKIQAWRRAHQEG